VVEWDVLHAPLTHEEIYGVIGEDSLINAFRIAEQSDPAALLVCNEEAALTDTSDERVQELIDLVKWLRGGGARVDAVGLEAEMKPPFLAPQAIELRLTRIAEGTGLPIVITALSVDAPKEDIQAATLKDLLTAFYASPAVRRVVMSEVWDAATPFGRTGLFRRNFAIKPAGQMLRTLLTQEWCTRETAMTDAGGVATLTGFQGDYEVTVAADGKQVKKQATLADANGAALVVELPR
jgi:GH35 family endo-1,4-beta-xylanase